MWIWGRHDSIYMNKGGRQPWSKFFFYSFPRTMLLIHVSCEGFQIVHFVIKQVGAYSRDSLVTRVAVDSLSFACLPRPSLPSVPMITNADQKNLHTGSVPWKSQAKTLKSSHVIFTTSIARYIFLFFFLLSQIKKQGKQRR